MAQFDILLTQNTHATGIEYSEKRVTWAPGILVTGDTNSAPLILSHPGTGKMLTTSGTGASAALVWVDIPTHHNQNTDTGTTSPTFLINSGSALGKLLFSASNTTTGNFTLTVRTPATLTADTTVTFQDKSGTNALLENKLSEFAPTTSAELFGRMSDKTGIGGLLVFATQPTLSSPIIDDIKASAAGVTADLWHEVTTGTINIGVGLTTGTLNLGTGTGAATVNVGRTGGTVNIAGGLDIGIDNAPVLATNGTGVIIAGTTTGTGSTVVLATSPTFVTSVLTSSTTFGVFDSTATINAFGAATTLNLGYDGTGAAITNIANGITAGATTNTINIGNNGAASSTTNVNIGSANGGTVTLQRDVSIGRDLSVGRDVVITGNLTVNGTTTTINSTSISVDDLTLELGSVAAPTDTTANGGGIVLKGATDKTILWDSTNNNWTSNQHWNLATGLSYKINNTVVLNATTLGTTVVNSSLTKVGALSGGTAGYVKVDATGNLTSVVNLYIGTTTVQSTSANQALTGILSTAYAGATSGTITLVPTAIAGTNTITLPAATGTVALTSNIGDGTLSASASTVGATNTTVAINFSGAYSANTSTNRTINAVVGPALSSLVTLMAAAPNGFITKTGVDTYSLDQNSYLKNWVPAPSTYDYEGTAGNVAYDGSYFYICTVTGVTGVARWKRTAMATNWS